jgi:hypothetical protein
MGKMISENAYIDALLEQRDLRGKMGKLLYGHYKYRYWNRESMRSSLREKEMKKDMQRELAEHTPSVFAPFYPDFTGAKTRQPKYSTKNISAFLLFIDTSYISYLFFQCFKHFPHFLMNNIDCFQRAHHDFKIGDFSRFIPPYHVHTID